MMIRELLAGKRPDEVVCIQPGNTLLDLADLLRVHNIGAVLVIDDNSGLVGLISERDLVRAVSEFRDAAVARQVSEVMTRKVITCTPDDNVVDTLAVMNEKRIRHMPVLDDGQPRAMISIREFDQACRQLQAQSRTDELTGLANRRYFTETLNKELSRCRRYRTPLSLALLDIDHFKHVNDTFGHDAGDMVLCALGKLLVHELRTFDGVARLGGEEFALLFPNTSADNAAIACERVLTAIRALEVATGEGNDPLHRKFRHRRSRHRDAGRPGPDPRRRPAALPGEKRRTKPRGRRSRGTGWSGRRGCLRRSGSIDQPDRPDRPGTAPTY